MNETVWVITFPSVFQALRAEKMLKAQGFAVELIPIPRQMSGTCEGLAAKLAEADVESAVQLLDRNGVPMVKKGEKVDRIY